MAWNAAADPNGLGYRQPEGASSDEDRRLPTLIPALSDRAAILSGRTPIRAGSGSGGAPEIVRVERQDGLVDWHSKR
jgi:hypothetical protein